MREVGAAEPAVAADVLLVDAAQVPQHVGLVLGPGGGAAQLGALVDLPGVVQAHQVEVVVQLEGRVDGDEAVVRAVDDVQAVAGPHHRDHEAVGGVGAVA